jgi:adenine-specific DNA methylase
VRASVCIFDPPYFDYIAYDELSEFYRVWRGLERLSGDLPTSAAEGDAFGIELGVALRSALARLEPGRLLAFTYHSTNHDAWRAVATAIDEAKMRVTALWPIFTDGHMGHHSFPGNCEWDLLVVCRRVTETVPAVAKLDVDAWAESVQPLRIGEADTRSMKLAIEVASSRFGRVSEGA